MKGVVDMNLYWIYLYAYKEVLERCLKGYEGWLVGRWGLGWGVYRLEGDVFCVFLNNLVFKLCCRIFYEKMR